jgi:predicted amidohydrolase
MLITWLHFTFKNVLGVFMNTFTERISASHIYLMMLLVTILRFVWQQPSVAEERPMSDKQTSNSEAGRQKSTALDTTKPAGKKIKVAAAQILTDCHDIEKNERKIVEKIKEARLQNCEIILFHEGCLTGYPNGEQIKAMDFSRVQKAEKAIKSLAKELHMAVLFGSSSKEEDKFYNYVLVINQQGEVLGRYEKSFRAGEPHYQAGSGPVIFTIAGIEATVIICHDLRYPILARLAVAAGAQVVFIANNESGITSEHKLLGYRSMQISRATENLVYSVMANSPADPDNVKRGNCSHGNSKIVDVMGNIIDEAGVFEERLVTGVLDLAKASRSPVLRTIGEDPETKEKYGVWSEIPAYTAWMKEGLKLVTRLDGSSGIPMHLQGE